ncbi:mitochondrial import inner membrane translocase, subunit timm23 [Dermatophagoides farinae]|uniref:Mitochondrial import inner membrane translocase, subunit timm23 n=2 Tax=Dermatophagoides farinae TaxID=6954 RepID=A0A922HZ64_DERFA|nr:mitochondrial import inner membrane translocase subunit Tim23-like isoform X1 [Dermatophagoides farinae]KAH9511954.1 mitochondrial import inner membrane translocase, subunit timm23 [Dermatophagoides farinae]
MDSSIMDNPINSLNGLNISSTNKSPFQSPFLQVDPTIFRSPDVISSEFIFPDGGTKPSRGRFEMAFSQIGGSIMTGAVIGGAIGTFKGLKEVAQMNESFAIKRSHMLNFITRNGASIANTFGSITLVYSAIGVGLSFVQDENDDINTMIAATTTGTLYGAISRSKAMDNVQGSLLTRMRLKRAGFGLTFGLLAGAALIILLNPDSKMISQLKHR